MNLPERPITILIAALGGEGGGVMADWLMEAATASGYPRSRPRRFPVWRNAPGPPRTATLYFSGRAHAAEWQRTRPLADAQSGNVDVMVASELIEAGRAMLNGFVSPERTTLIASTHRIYATVEKMQMADGRFDSDRVRDTPRLDSRENRRLFDMRKLAQERHGDQCRAVRRHGGQRRAAAVARRV